MPKPGYIVITLWMVWAVSWLVAGLWADRARARPPVGSEWPYRLVTFLGGVLLILRQRDNWHHPIMVWAGMALIVLGCGFAWWARLHLGKLWSANVTTKQDHRVVDTGPYGLVRHPIYTGLLISVLGTALIHGNVRGWCGAALMLVGFYLKARLEEGFLRQQLGAEAYDGYAARVPMLVPGLK